MLGEPGAIASSAALRLRGKPFDIDEIGT